MHHFLTNILQDWQINRETSSKSRLILLLFRVGQSLENLPKPFALVSTIYRLLYILMVDWLLGVDLPCDTQIGSPLKLLHGHALVVNHETVIGTHCTLRHATTIGNKQLPDGSYSRSPRIGNHVDIGSNVVIIGAINIGDFAVIGAGAVVVKDVPEYAVVAGNPARVIRMLKPVSLSEPELTPVIAQSNLMTNRSDVAHLSQ
jgi:putative colanic acid biosynthesis acetyltransferase WcaB